MTHQREWQKFFRVLVAIDWGLIVMSVLIDCTPPDVRTAEGLVPHFLSWVVIGFIGLAGTVARAWRAPRIWAQSVLFGCIVISLLDILMFYFVGICALGLSIGQMRRHVLATPLVLLASLQMFAMVAGGGAPLVPFVSGRDRRPIDS